MTQDGSEQVVVDCRDLEAFAAEILTAVDVQISVATQWSSALVWADLRGVESHGVSRLPQYVTGLRSGEINTDPQWATLGEGAVAIVDADRAPGVSAMLAASMQQLRLPNVYTSDGAPFGIWGTGERSDISPIRCTAWNGSQSRSVHQYPPWRITEQTCLRWVPIHWPLRFQHPLIPWY